MLMSFSQLLAGDNMTTTPTVEQGAAMTILWPLGNNEQGDGVIVLNPRVLAIHVTGTDGSQSGSPQGITMQWSPDNGTTWFNMTSGFDGIQNNMLNGSVAIVTGFTMPTFMLRATSGLGVQTATDLDAKVYVW